MRALLLSFALALLPIAGCSAIVSSENPEPACEQWPGDANPCPMGSRCVGEPDGDGIVHGVCQRGGMEICDGIDNDGNGQTDEDPTFDTDGDGYTWCGSGNPMRRDCDDGNPSVHPYNADTMSPMEVCDGIDNDCNGVVDDPMRACPAATPFCSTARRCYQSGDCSVPEVGDCGAGLFCDLSGPSPHCATIPPTGCLGMTGACGAGMRCNPSTNMCEALLPLGAACGTDSDCETGACFEAAALSYDGTGTGRVCSSPCCATADCGGGGVCRVTARGARGCVPVGGNDAAGACGDDRDCDSGNVCRAFGNVATGGADRLRTVCAPGSRVSPSGCTRGLCIGSFCWECDSTVCLSDGCATSCTTGADCYSGICSSGLCRYACRTSADCPEEMRCGLLSRGDDRIQGCVFRQTDRAPTGASCSNATDCADSYCSPEGVCAPVCCTDSDCGGGVCRPVNNGGWEMRCIGRQSPT
jgi:hypothetical protein